MASVAGRRDRHEQTAVSESEVETWTSPARAAASRRTIKTRANSCLINHCTIPQPAPATLSAVAPAMHQSRLLSPSLLSIACARPRMRRRRQQPEHVFQQYYLLPFLPSLANTATTS